MLRGILTLLVALSGLAAPAGAQEGPEWDLQRCIWSCLAGRGATDPAYHACVDNRCNVPAASPPPATTDPTWIWRTGNTGFGLLFAQIDALGEAGQTGIRYTCGLGRSFFSLHGPNMNVVPMLFDIDGVVYPISFVGGAQGWPDAHVPLGTPLFSALQFGQRFILRQQNGQPIAEFSLNGAGQALARTISAC